MNKKRLEILGLILFLLILCAGLAVLLAVFIREHRRGASLAEAVEAFETGHLAEARQKFKAILREDENQERAYVGLAEIAEKESRWQDAASHWRRAVSLNSLKTEYRDRWKRALALGRDFLSLRENFIIHMDLSQVQSDEDSFYILLTAENPRARALMEYRELLKKENPDFFTTDYGQLIACLESRDRSAKVMQDFERLSRSGDLAVSFEALIQLAVRKVAAGDLQSAEKILRQAVEKNPFSGLPYLESFYIDNLRFDRAIECCVSDFRRFRRPWTAIQLAELHLLSGEAAKIRPLLSSLAGNSKAEIITTDYLESLIAFAANDAAGVAAKFPRGGRYVRTPVSALVGLYEAVSSGNVPAVKTAWKEFQQMPPFYDLRARGEKLLFAGVGKMILQKKTDDAVSLLEMRGVDFTADRGISEFFIGSKFRRGGLLNSDLDRALKKYPDSPVLLAVGAKYFQHLREFRRSAALADRAMKQLPPAEKYPMQALQALNYAGMGKSNEAGSVLRQILAVRPGDSRILLAACRFAREQSRPALLENICRDLAGAKSPLLPFAEGSLLVMQGRHAEALERFAQLDAGSPELLFQTAKILGENNRIAPAVRLYRKILETERPGSRIRPFALANLAELQIAGNDLKTAEKTAEEAWRLLPRHQAVQTCYAGLLFRGGKWREVLNVISPTPYLDAPGSPRRKLWIGAAEKELSRRDLPVDERSKQLCSNLLAMAPASDAGLNFRKKIQQAAKKK